MNAEPGAISGETALPPFWTMSAATTCAELICSRDGLSAAEADRRLLRYGQNADAQGAKTGALRAIPRRLLEPLSLILLAVAIVSVGTGDIIGGSIIAVILCHASPLTFRTAWFLESMATQILVIFIIRTNGRPWSDLPRPILTATSLGALPVAMALPFTPLAILFGFRHRRWR